MAAGHQHQQKQQHANTTIASYFEKNGLADEVVGGVGSGVTNGFVVARLVEGWQKFREKIVAKKMLIESVTVTSSTLRPHLIRFAVTFSGDQEVMSAIIKMPRTYPGVVEKLSDQQPEIGKRIAEIVAKTHNREAQFYRLFGNNNVDKFPLPQCYYIKEYNNKSSVDGQQDPAEAAPMIIMEDLGMVARDVDMTERFNFEQAKSIVAGLAKFHQHLLITCMHGDGEDEWRKNEAFERQPLFSKLQIEQLKILEENATGKMACFADVAKQLRMGLDEKFLEYANKQMQGLPDVLVHGDLNQGNVLFSRADPTHLHAFIDFQTVHIGSILVDLERVLFHTDKGAEEEDSFLTTGAKVLINDDNGGADAEGNKMTATGQKNGVEARLLAHYYEHLSGDFMRKSGKEAGDWPGFSQDQLLRAYRICKLAAAVTQLLPYVAMCSPYMSKEALKADTTPLLQQIYAYSVEAAQILSEEIGRNLMKMRE